MSRQDAAERNMRLNYNQRLFYNRWPELKDQSAVLHLPVTSLLRSESIRSRQDCWGDTRVMYTYSFHHKKITWVHLKLLFLYFWWLILNSGVVTQIYPIKRDLWQQANSTCYISLHCVCLCVSLSVCLSAAAHQCQIQSGNLTDVPLSTKRRLSVAEGCGLMDNVVVVMTSEQSLVRTWACWGLRWPRRLMVSGLLFKLLSSRHYASNSSCHLKSFHQTC